MIRELVKIAHETAISKGFWSLSSNEKIEASSYDLEDRNDGELIALMHSELSEALEELRKEKPNMKNVAEEMADCVIRIGDFCGARGIDLENAIIRKMKKNKKRKHRHGKRF